MAEAHRQATLPAHRPDVHPAGEHWEREQWKWRQGQDRLSYHPGKHPSHCWRSPVGPEPMPKPQPESPSETNREWVGEREDLQGEM